MTSKKPTWHFKGNDPTYVDIAGMSIPWPAVELAIELEGRNLRMIVDGDKLRVSTASGERPTLSPSDIDRIKQWKTHLIELATWIESLDVDHGADL